MLRKSSFVPGHHLFLLVGGVAAAAQVLIGGGEEVQRVVLEVLVDERKKNLGRTLKKLGKNNTN